MPKYLKDCKGMVNDIKRIENWAQIFKHPKQLVQLMVGNIIKNYDPIVKLIKHIEAEVSWGNPEDFMYAGVDTASILVLTLGTVPELEETSASLED